jgi:hypothetical protein
MSKGRTLLWFVVRLIAVSVVLFLLWEWKLYVGYAMLFHTVAKPIYALIGVQLSTMQEPISLVAARFYNVIPFISLLVASWGLTWKRRLLGACVGLAAILVWHLAFPLIVRGIIASYGLGPTAYQRLSPWFLLSDALPLILWAVIAYPALAMLFERPSAAVKAARPLNGKRA